MQYDGHDDEMQHDGHDSDKMQQCNISIKNSSGARNSKNKAIVRTMNTSS